MKKKSPNPCRLQDSGVNKIHLMNSVIDFLTPYNGTNYSYDPQVKQAEFQWLYFLIFLMLPVNQKFFYYY